MDDIDHLIITKEQAIELTPVDHPDRAAMLNNFGIALRSRSEKSSVGKNCHL
jgi:hypothetical protein